MIKKISQGGFTIIELLIATSVFGVILLIVTFSIIFISKLYINGFVQTQTQNIAVSLSDEISRDIEFSNPSDVIPDSVAPTTIGGLNYYHFCTESNLYGYSPGTYQSSSTPAFFQAPIASLPLTSCTLNGVGSLASIMGLIDYRGLLSNGMELLNDPTASLPILHLQSNSGVYTILLKLVNDDANSGFLNGNNQCLSINLIPPDCATYNINTSVYPGGGSL
ncbi:MAG TPA: type II secretion system protein [Candidatus Saccharimonadia bacterium]|nr:type II secretion system protein [Candidatus Saccharimonadia bacterium]